MARNRDSDRDGGIDGKQGVGSEESPLVQLQQAHGNRMVGRLAEAGIRPKLEVGHPDDRYEREADRVAERVVRASASGAADRPGGTGPTSPIRHRGSTGGVQRQEGAGRAQSAEYEEAAKKTGEAFLKTELGRKLTEPAKELGEAFWASLAGKVLTGVAVAGTVATLAATNEALPMQLPTIPLDVVTPGLSMNLTYEGPARQPTKAFVSFSYEFGAGGSGRGETGPSAAERRRTETARTAREQFEFRQSLKTPEQRAAEERILWEVISRGRGPLGLPTIPGLKVVENPPPKLNLSPRGTGREDDETLRRTESPVGASRSVSRAPPGIVDEVLRSPGRPLDDGTRRAMEGGFGRDFSEVRVHTDDRAAASARAVGALAYTVGRDVVFGAGEYRPGTLTGRRLLAHELAHVVQQSSTARGPLVQRSIRDAFDQYRGTCDCGRDLGNNCAHYLSDAFIRAGYDELDGGEGGLYRRHDGRVVCEAGRPVRAREMWDWFAGRATDSHDGEPDDDRSWAVFQQQPGGYWGGHVVIHDHDGTDYEFRGTGDYPEWETQAHYTW